MSEIWKDVIGYEGLYQVSNLGNVKCLSRFQIYTDKNGKSYKRCKREHLLIPADMQRGYLGVTLYKDGRKLTKAVHKLVAESFIPNPFNLPQVNHRDECKGNNSVENLEWCTCKYNNNYGTANERRSNTRRRKWGNAI